MAAGLLIVTLASAVVGFRSSAWAFTVAPSTGVQHRQATATPSQLRVSVMGDITDEDGRILMDQAWECANSDTCSVEEAQSFIRNVVRFQNGCAAGGMLGADVCGDDSLIRSTEVIGELRAKVQKEAKAKSSNFWKIRQEDLEDLVAASLSNNAEHRLSFTNALFRPAIRLPFLAVAALYFCFVVAVLSATSSGPAIADETVLTPTAQEWWWAVKGGYLDNMVSHVIRNGGL